MLLYMTKYSKNNRRRTNRRRTNRRRTNRRRTNRRINRRRTNRRTNRRRTYRRKLLKGGANSSDLDRAFRDYLIVKGNPENIPPLSPYLSLTPDEQKAVREKANGNQIDVAAEILGVEKNSSEEKINEALKAEMAKLQSQTENLLRKEEEHMINWAATLLKREVGGGGGGAAPSPTPAAPVSPVAPVDPVGPVGPAAPSLPSTPAPTAAAGAGGGGGKAAAEHHIIGILKPFYDVEDIKYAIRLNGLNIDKVSQFLKEQEKLEKERYIMELREQERLRERELQLRSERFMAERRKIKPLVEAELIKRGEDKEGPNFKKMVSEITEVRVHQNLGPYMPELLPPKMRRR